MLKQEPFLLSQILFLIYKVNVSVNALVREAAELALWIKNNVR